MKSNEKFYAILVKLSQTDGNTFADVIKQKKSDYKDKVLHFRNNGVGFWNGDSWRFKIET